MSSGVFRMAATATVGYAGAMKIPVSLCAALLCFCARALPAETVVNVAADGSAKFKSVQEAIMSVPLGTRENPVVIRIAPGTYKELIYLQREKRFFKLVGENATNTVLTFNLYAGITNAEGKPIGTFKTPSTTIDADDFTAENITFENSAGPVGQALAIRVDGDRASFRHCRFLGCQDTILINRGRQYFENCYVEGSVDFIFGAATAWFEKCEIHALRDGYLTAASTPVDVPFGYVFNRCQITGEPGVQTFLGRPWRQFASTIYLNCELSDVVRSEGWNDWKKPHETIRYAEFNSTGAGANPTNRIDWAKQLSADEAKKITVEKVLGGNDGWNPSAPPLDASMAATKYDICYGEANGEKLLLDAHVPADNGKFPVVLIVHGGGWMGGDKETDIVPVFAPFATNFVWFTINYRLAPTNRWPACFDDVQTAIRWVKAHAAEFKGDPNRIALLGYSAGGHLVTLAGTHPEKPNAILKFLHLTKITSTEVQAVAAFAPPTDLVADNERRGGLSISMRNLFGYESSNITDNVCAVLKKNSPLTYVKTGRPPFLVINGSADKTVPVGQSENFVKALKAANVDATLITIPEGQHRITDWKKFLPGWQQQLVAWLNEKLAAK
jgi:pectinesterase